MQRMNKKADLELDIIIKLILALIILIIIIGIVFLFRGKSGVILDKLKDIFRFGS